jgi:hypothetical protein
MKNGYVRVGAADRSAIFERPGSAAERGEEIVRSIRISIVAALAVAAAFTAPASAQAPEPVKDTFITAGNAADQAERQAIDFTCWVIFGAEPGDCVS